MSEEAEKEIQKLKELNTTLSKALAEEMTSNFKQTHLRSKLEEKLERIEEWVTQFDNTGIGNTAWSILKGILKEEKQ